MKKNFILSFLALLFIFCSQCRKHKRLPAELPPITQEGKNTFGCKVDGEIWTPYYRCGDDANPCWEVISVINPLNLQHKLPLQINIRIDKKYNNSHTSFQINTPTNSGISAPGDKIDSIKLEYVEPGSIQYVEIPGLDATNKFTITKLDTINKIISGTFAATLYTSATDSVKITEGRFDLKF